MGGGGGGGGEQANERAFSQGLVLGFGFRVLAQADLIARLETENPLAVRSERRALRVQLRLPHHPPPPPHPPTPTQTSVSHLELNVFRFHRDPPQAQPLPGAPRSSAPLPRPALVAAGARFASLAASKRQLSTATASCPRPPPPPIPPPTSPPPRPTDSSRRPAEVG